MGRSITPMYRLEFSGMNYGHQCWKGRASNATLAAYMQAFIASLQPGGVNAHVGVYANAIPHSARIVRQSTGDIVARWAPGCAHQATQQTVLRAAETVQFTECLDCGKTLRTESVSR